MLTVRLKNKSPIVADYQHLLKIYQQGKEDYQNGKTNNE